MKKIYLMILCAFWIVGVNAQAPANDVCSGAILIPPTGPFPYLTGATSNVDATDTDDPVSSCQANSHKALWYSFTPAATGNYYISSCQSDAPLSTISDNILAIYTSATGCTGPFTQISCDDDGCTTLNLQGVISSIVLTGGTTYYILVSGYNTSVGNVQLNIKQAAPPPPPPSNDDCSGAIALTVNADLNCGVTTLASTVGATASTGETTPTCVATGADDDIWYKFTATATSHVISLTSDSGNTDRAMQLYSGACGALVPVICSDPESMTATGLTIGQTYTLRVYTYANSTTTRAKFRICVGTLPPPPANDEAAGALGLTVNADYLCAVSASGTTFSATQSPDAAPTCSATGINDDVWYYFTATAAAHRISLTGTSNTMAAALYTGTPGSLTFLTGTCASTTLNATSLTIGTTYYVRAYTTSSVTTTGSNFTICVGTPPPPPVNDDAAGAISLVVNPDVNCTTVTSGTTVSATQSVDAAPTCSATGINDDVWFKFTATGSAHNISVAGTSNTTAVALYVGTPGSLSFVNGACASTTLEAGGLTSGVTYYVRVYTTSNVVSTNSNFDICVTTLPTPVPNDECNAAITLTVNADLNCGVTTFATTVGATSSTGVTSPTCAATGINDDIWYKFTATANTHVISLTSDSGSTDRAMQLYSGTCGSLVAVSCSDPETMTSSGLTIGETYILRVYTFSSTATVRSNFYICVGTLPPPPSNDDAAGAIALTVNADYDCGITTAGTTASATQSPEAAPTCSATGINDDVWYTFTATNTAHRIFFSGTSNTMVSALYNGTPGSLTFVTGACASTTLNAIGLTIGETYYVRAYTSSSTASTFSNFNICVGTEPGAPANDDAPGAIALTLGSGCTGNFSIGGATQSATEPYGTCSATAGYATVWYKFTAPASGSVRMSTDYTGRSLTDTRIALFSAADVNDYSSFSLIGCDEDGGSVVGNASVLYATGLIAGNTYYIQVDKYSSTTSGTTFCLTVDELNASMLSTSTNCAAGQSNFGSQSSYTGWVSLMDTESKLIAMVKNPTGGSVNAYTTAQNINAAAVRTSNLGTPYLDRNYLINNSTATNVEVQFFFLASELAALNVVDGTTLATLGVSRQAGTVCRADFSRANGIPEVLPQTGNGATADGLINWVTVVTPSFSNFYLHKAATVLTISLEYF